MKSAKEFKERLEKDLEFKKKFENVKSQDEVIKIAKENGYDLTDCSKQEEEQLTEDLLENVAGGKNDYTLIEEKIVPDGVIGYTDENGKTKYVSQY